MAAPVLSESFRKPKMDFDREVKGENFLSTNLPGINSFCYILLSFFTLAGIKKMSRMQFCLKSVNEWLGQAVGSMYIRNFFPEEHKQDVSIRNNIPCLTLEISPPLR